MGGNKIRVHGREELVKFLQGIIDERKVNRLAEKLMSYPSGTEFIFVCRQFDPYDQGLGHRQQAIRVFHS